MIKRWKTCLYICWLYFHLVIYWVFSPLFWRNKYYIMAIKVIIEFELESIRGE